MKLKLSSVPVNKGNRTSVLSSFSSIISKTIFGASALLLSAGAFAQTGTWALLTNTAPDYNQGVMLLMTDGTVIAHDATGTGLGTGWDKLTPDNTGSYANGTWTQIASMSYDRLFFPTQVFPDGKVLAAGGEYGAGATRGEIYDPTTNKWTATGSVGGQNIFDGNSEILPNGQVLVGVQNGNNPSYDDLFYNEGTNSWATAPIAPLNHDEAAWIKLPDSSILFVGIGTKSSCRYIPKTNSWVSDGTLPVSLYDTYGYEAGAAILLPNGKAVFFGATGHNAIYTPSGNTSPGTWAAGADFPKIGGKQVGQVDAPACMMPNGKILCAVSPIGTSPSNEFNSPCYFVEYNYLTDSYTQVHSVLTGLGGDSITVNCDFTTMLLLPTGQVLLGVNQTGYSQYYWIYTPNGSAIAADKPVLNSVYQTTCGTHFYMTGKNFNGISEGAAFGDDWAMSTNYPLVRFTDGTNVWYATTSNWNRIGAVMTDSLEDTAQFTLPAAMPTGTYTMQVVVNGVPSSDWIFSTYGVAATVVSNVSCKGASDGKATATVSGGNSPYTYSWSPGGGTSATMSNLSAGTYTVTVTDKIGCTTTASVTITQPATGITVTIGSVVNEPCKGGTTGKATATATGGTSPYTYAWAPSGGTNATASNLTAGTYTVTVNDTKGCSSTASVTITQPATGVTVTIGSVVNEPCKGGTTGSAKATASGGTSPYTYSWSPSGGTNATASNLSAGSYTVTVSDAGGCTTTASVTITQPATGLTVTIGSVVNEPCKGGTTGKATATATGGTSPYTYAWAPSGGTNATASNLSAGSYTVTVTDVGGCSGTASVTITQPATGITVTIGSIVNEPCKGGTTGSATATATGGTSPYTYAWAPSGGTNATASNLSAGSYTVTVSDAGGCNTTASVTITQPATGLTVTIGSIVNESCNGGSTGSMKATPTGGTSPYTYGWAPSGGTSATASNLSVGSYTVTVTDAGGCTGTATATITQPSAISISFGSYINEKCNGGKGGAVTATVTGGTPGYTYSWAPSGGAAAKASNLSAGTYTVTVTDKNGCTMTAAATITQPAAIAISFGSYVNEQCNGGKGGSVIATVSGGTPGYTYAWTPSGGTSAKGTYLSAGTYTVTVTDKNGCTMTAAATITQPPVIAISFGSMSNVSCNGGSDGIINATPTGGTGTYTYSWAPSGGTGATASNLSAGTYTVTVTDANGCAKTASASITQPTAITVSFGSKSNVSCNGGSDGSVNGIPSGGTPGYTYSWAPSGGNGATASNLSAGTYTLTITDANGCTKTATTSITQPTVISLTTSATQTTCSGSTGTATVAPTGGTPGYSYSWAPSGGTGVTASNLSAGTYTVTVTDANGCSVTATADVTDAGGETVSIANTTNVSCNGSSTGSITTSTSGGTTPYTYSWSPSGGTGANTTGLSAGTYTVTVTDASGCTSTATATITEPAAMSVTQNYNPTTAQTVCDGSAWVTVTGGISPYTYKWNNGATTDTITKLCNGNYCCTVTDANGCNDSVCVSVVTGIPVIGGAASIKIFPDPNNGYFTVSGLVKGQVIEMYNYIGQQISTDVASNTTMHFSIVNNPNGVYLIRIISKDGKLVKEAKLIKTN